MPVFDNWKRMLLAFHERDFVYLDESDAKVNIRIFHADAFDVSLYCDKRLSLKLQITFDSVYSANSIHYQFLVEYDRNPESIYSISCLLILGDNGPIRIKYTEHSSQTVALYSLLESIYMCYDGHGRITSNHFVNFENMTQFAKSRIYHGAIGDLVSVIVGEDSFAGCEGEWFRHFAFMLDSAETFLCQ